MSKSNNPYLLDEQAQQCLKDGIDSLWQAHALIGFIQQSLTADEMADHYTALNGVLALMNKGLDDLAEV